jgi:hypothetical protein
MKAQFGKEQSETGLSSNLQFAAGREGEDSGRFTS